MVCISWNVEISVDAARQLISTFWTVEVGCTGVRCLSLHDLFGWITCLQIGKSNIALI